MATPQVAPPAPGGAGVAAASAFVGDAGAACRPVLGRVVMLLENQTYPEDVRVRNEAESLTRHGWQVTVIAPRREGQQARETVRGVRVWRFRLPHAGAGMKGYLAEYAVAHAQLWSRALVRLVRGADVVHLHNPPDTLFPIGLLARGLGKRLVYDHHDLSAELFAEKFGSSRVETVLRAAQWASFRSADAAIVTNESQREVALSNGARDSGDVHIVRNGPRRHTLVETVRPRAGVLADPRLVFVGEIASQDGVADLPALLAHPDLARAHLTIVGDGPDRDELERQFAAAGLSDRVRFTGWVKHEEVAGLIAEADICVDPAPCTPLNHQSTMIKIGEYLAAGRPVVAYELVESRRTARDAARFARAGNSRGFGDLVAELAKDPDRRIALGVRARARAEELVWERSEEVLIRAYATLVP